MSYAGFRDTRRISELTKQDPSFRSLRIFAKQLKFTVDLPGQHRHGKPRLIADLIPNSGEVTFDKHGEEITVAVSSLVHHFVAGPDSD
jgi:eukaryotic translation initiation factor 2C